MSYERLPFLNLFMQSASTVTSHEWVFLHPSFGACSLDGAWSAMEGALSARGAKNRTLCVSIDW